MTAKTEATIECHYCGGRAEPMIWMPPEGHDPMMRKFKCRSCQQIFYYWIARASHLKRVDLAIAERVKSVETKE